MSVAAVFAASFEAKADLRNIFPDVSKIPDVTSVYVGKALLRAAGSQNMIGSGTVDLGKLAANIDQLQVVMSEKKKSSKQLREIFNNYMNANRDYSILAQVQESDDKKGNGQEVTIYAQENPANPDIIKDAIIVVRDEEEFIFVGIMGEIPLQALMSTLGQDSDDNN